MDPRTFYQSINKTDCCLYYDNTTFTSTLISVVGVLLSLTTPLHYWCAWNDLSVPSCCFNFILLIPIELGSLTAVETIVFKFGQFMVIIGAWNGENQLEKIVLLFISVLHDIRPLKSSSSSISEGADRAYNKPRNASIDVMKWWSIFEKLCFTGDRCRQ